VPKTKENPTVSKKQQVAEVASRRDVHAAFSWLRAHEREITEAQMELARVPAPPFGEQARTAWMLKKFRELGLDDVHADELGSVFGTHRGSERDKTAVAVAAHIDTVFPAGTAIEIRNDKDGKLHGPSVSDNSSGVAALLAIASALVNCDVEHEHDIVFIGDVGEEGEGDLRGMRHIFSVEHKKKWRDRIAYTVVVDGNGHDTIVNQALGSKRFEVTVHGKGGHSWADFGEPNPIVVLSRALAEFYKTPIYDGPDSKSSYNVGVIGGGTSVNSIPESATARVDVRSTVPAEIERIAEQLRQCVVRAGMDEMMVPARQKGQRISELSPGSLRVEMKPIGERPAGKLPDDCRILQVAKAVDSHLGIPSQMRLASTDANIPISMGLEAITLGSGGSGGGAHTLKEWFDPKGREIALKRILLVLLSLACE
jgi:acetylornithine deacetylase/succinyl-diaminopimelate desuccinylase-like protein